MIGMVSMLEKDEFLKKYGISDIFNESDLTWSNLVEIYEDYCSKQESLKLCREKLERYIFEPICDSTLTKVNGQPKIDAIHSIKSRIKNPEHLIEKIIRKQGKEHSHKYSQIDKDNYTYIVKDLIGIRILTLEKEGWEPVHDLLCLKFPPRDGTGGSKRYMSDEKNNPIAYARYGDRNIFKNKIYIEHTNIGYRSQHYVVGFDGFFCEIQVRTLAEEVYGEFDHKVKYPYKSENNFLVRYTRTLSQLTDAVDELISTCLSMEDNWDDCGKTFKQDVYIDWQHTSQSQRIMFPNTSTVGISFSDEPINIKDYTNKILFGKE